MSKPTVRLHSVAALHAGADERIIEVAHDIGGCLISIRPINGQLSIQIYRADPTVFVIAPRAHSAEPNDTTTYAVGDPDPTPDDIDIPDFCYHPCEPVGSCTWRRGHPGQHVAGNDEIVVGVANVDSVDYRKGGQRDGQ